MSRRKRCLNFQWRDDDPTFRAERDNDRLVFRKLKRECAKPHRAHNLTRIIRRLFKSDLWAPRLTGKSAESWRVNYYRWRREKCSGVQAKKSSFKACKHGAKRKREKFYRETVRHCSPTSGQFRPKEARKIRS